MRAFLCSLAIFVVLPLFASDAFAQTDETRIAAEALGGTAGAVMGGLGGLAVGTGGSLLFGPGEIEPAPPIIGLILGASSGASSGVFLGGEATGGGGQIGHTVVGLLAGGAVSAGLFGMAWLIERKSPSTVVAGVLVASMAVLPLTGAMVGYELSR